jgi:hypothetical protein
MAATAVVLATVLFAVVSVRISRHNNNTAIVECIRGRGRADYQLATFRYFSPSLVYYSNRCVLDCRDTDQVREFFRHAETPFLVTKAEEFGRLTGSLPADAVECLRQRRFLHSGDVVLIGRSACLAARDAESLKK